MPDEFDYTCEQEGSERSDEAELYAEAARDEIRCALALYRSLKRDFNQYRAAKVDGDLNWTITKPRTSAALLAALETEEPALEAAITPLVERLNKWEATQAMRGGWMPPDGKRIEVRLGDLRALRAAVAESETPNPSPPSGISREDEG